MGGQEFAPFGWWESMGGDFISYFLYESDLTLSFFLILQKEGPRTTGRGLPQDLEHVRVHIFMRAVRFVSF